MPDPNQNQQQNPTTGVPFSPQTDLPPLPPEFQNLDAKPTTPESSTENSGTAAPPTPTFSSIATSSPKKKFGTGRIIATILGIFFLVGATLSATYVVNQRRHSLSFTSQAGCTSGCYFDLDGDGKISGNEWVADQEALDSFRSTLSNEDSRAQVIDYTNQAAQQATCQSYGPCQCGTYTGGDGCTHCYTDCQNRTTTSSDAAIQQQFANSKVCGSGWYVCYYGCCQVGGTEHTVPSGYTNASAFLEANFGISVTMDDAGNVTSVTKTKNAVGETFSANEVFYTICPKSGGKAISCVGGNDCNCTENQGLCIGGTWIESNGMYICGYNGTFTCNGPSAGGGDPCSTDGKTPGICQDTGVIRCKCGSGEGSWVGGIAVRCDDLCQAANLPCDGGCDEPVTGSTPPPATPPPPGTYQCQRIKAYDSEWTLLDNDGLSKLKAGDVVRFGIIFVVDGTADKARFTVNGTLRPEVTAIKPGTTTEFYDEYTIPEGVTSFNVTGQIYSTTIGWF